MTATEQKREKGFKPTEWPTLKLPTREKAEAMKALPAEDGEKYPNRLVEVLMRREELIRLEQADPFRYGYEPEVWKRVDGIWLLEIKEVLILGGNRASKSEYAAKLVVKTLVENPKARVWCFQTTNDNSIEMQQALVWKYLPAELKNKKKGQVTNISYSQKNGFSENTFVCPNGSQCWFRHYSQDIRTIEGGEIDLAWCDELVPLNWLETIRFRLVTRNGRLLVTFTPIEGYSATVADYLKGAKTIEEVEAELLPVMDKDGDKVEFYEAVPRVQIPVKGNARVLYFHTADNPYSNYERLKNDLKGAKREKILERAYGVPTKAIANRFPKFRDKVHVIPDARIPKEGTNYHFVDPCGGRNWFMTWIRVDVKGRLFIYREWPCPSVYIEGVGIPGMWAEPDGKKADGRPGPAQQAFGFGLKRYKEEIERLEKGEEIFERFMDSRYGNAQTVAREAATTLIEECDEIDLTFLATPGENIDEGVGLVNDLIDYDTERPIDATNEPRLYVAESCENTIYALKEWTGLDGKKGACKDPIDNIRYGVLARIGFVNDEILRCRGGGSY